MEVLELNVWPGDWGLPSLDLECLQVLVYAKFNGINVKVNYTNPYNAPYGRLPVLQTDMSKLDTAEKIIAYFKEKQCSNSEDRLAPEECATALAYANLLRDKLYPALQFIWWIDKKNVDELIRPWYCRTLPFPIKFYYPGKFERQSRTLFECLYPIEDNITDIENKVYSDARKCLTLLSTRLEDSNYFFGDSPTILDATLYSYLALLLKIPLPNPTLQNHLKACTNLVKYVSRISQMYFEHENQEYEQRKADENTHTVKKDSESEFPNKRRNQVFAGVFATLAMAVYAVSNGLVRQ
ncbi:PREDICTED: metaxin-1 isoform X2 [Dufourea novaeangliae]|uniref:metaxin-1 isoform X2 n=1 Tax=Dufourea novaeangliae TaxID=178035 RepID=UPI000766FF7F|nr:PREDICTED: metaxin-1 isoform X2 [Dufourea novaeangliae]